MLKAKKRTTKCSLCGHTYNRELYLKYKNYYLVRCDFCSFVSVKNTPTESELNSFYSSKDYENPLTAEEVIRTEAKISINMISKFLNNGKLLDIGCGRGYFMDEAIKKGWEAEGFDYSRSVVNYATNKLDLNVKRKNIFSFRTESKYDLVTLIQFIEHFPNPVDVFKKALSFVKASGYVYVATPNIDSLISKVCRKEFDHIIPPEHLSFFSSKSLNHMFSQQNVEIVYLGTWSTSQEFVSILRRLKRKVLGFNTKLKNKNEILSFNKETSNIAIRDEFKILDNYIAPKIHKFLDVFNQGSMVHILGRKKGF